MPNRDDILSEKTFKDGMDTMGQRVYYTCTQNADRHLRLHRTTKLLSVLIERLHQDGVLSDEAIDDLLLDVVRVRTSRRGVT
jgi:hypothetical protein